MNKHQYLKPFFFVLLLSVTALLNAQDFTVGNLNYSVQSGTDVIVTGHVDGTAATGPLVIPETVIFDGTTYTVTMIDGFAFWNCSGITGDLNIPNSVTSIGEYAFSDCGGFNGSLTLSNNLSSIADNAFYGCSGFTGDLVIPNSVTSIGYEAFSGCSGFTGSLTISNNITFIADNAFYGCSGFTGELIIPNSVTSIGSSAFSGCSGFTGSLVIPYGVEYIGWNTFLNCSGFMGDLIIPNSVTTIEPFAFSGCSGFTGDLNIPNSVTAIGVYAFNGCSSFDGSLIISNNVQSVNNQVFENCSGFTGNLVIPNSVSSIGVSAFSGCSGFTGDLVIPNTVSSIGSGAFSGCSGFTGSLILSNNLSSIANNVFYGCNGFTGSLTIPDNVTSIGNNAFSGCSSFSDTLTLCASLTGIGNNAFFGACENFTALNVWAEVPPIIGTDAFTSMDHSIPVSILSGTCDAYLNAPGWNAFTNFIVLEPHEGFEITVTANPAEAGTTRGSCLYLEGQTCTLIAFPNPGYAFAYWTENGEVVSSNHVYSFTVEEDRDLEANFVVAEIHHFVDLGLPSGTLWATCNLGADSPEGYGNAYTWDEAQPDAATAYWGSDWRMPTSTELQELIDNTTVTWFNWNGINNPAFGVYGMLFTAPNGNSVFLRSIHIWTDMYSGGIWASDKWGLAYGLDNGCPYYYVEDFSDFSSSSSCPIRPVRTSTQIPTHVINVTVNHADFGEVSGGGSYLECSMCTVTATITNEDCVFAYWKENDEIVSMDTTYTFMVTGDRNLVACFFHPDFHEYVDLGLPSGTMWATCNVGSCYPEQDYSTTPYYSWGCGYCEGSKLTKYCNNPDYGVNGYSDTLTMLLPEDDVATYEWGVGWRMPTAEEWEELTQNTTFTWKLVYNNGEVVGSGALFTAPNGNSVFLPAINRKYDPTITFFDLEQGPFYYWTSSLDTINPLKAYHISGDPSTYEMGSSSRCESLCVRPVLSTVPSDFYTVTVTVHPEEGGTVTGTGEYSFGETCSLTAIPNENFVFSNWKKDGVVVSTDATYSFRVYGNCSYEACFVHSNPTYVDLGLPSGLLWADCNVGANSPEEYGDCFAWGETQPKRKYDWDTYRYCTKYFTTPSDFIYILTKYNAEDSLTILEPEDDAATMLYDNISHTPTKEEWQELIDNCTSVWTIQNGVEGRQFIGPSGDSIFLPAKTSTSPEGYLSSSLYVSEDPSLSTSYYCGWYFYFHPYNYFMKGDGVRCGGFPVRAVRPVGLTYTINATANPTESGTISGTGSYFENSTCTLTATANDGYTFINWTKDGTEVSTAATYSFTVTENADFVANFALSTCTITTTANPTDGGTVTGAGTYDYGATATLSAVPNEGYRFSRWTKDGTTVSTNAIYSFTVTENAAFVANFTAYNPDVDIIQTTNFAQGWNWWSTYIEAEDLIDQLENGLGTNGITIKSQNGFVQYSPEYGIWYGSNNFSINNESYYMVQTNADCTVEIIGSQADPSDHPITLATGWNWMGYPCISHMSFTNAFLGFMPSDNDQVKSQGHGFASYMAAYGIWYGTLADYGIDPGMGLMYKSNNGDAVTFVYPESRGDSETVSNTVANNHWTADYHAYPNNMTVTAVVELDGVELQGDNYELAAFANGECRGSVRLMYVASLNRYMAFLTVAGDEAAELTFGLYDTEHGTVVETCRGASLQYETNAVVGNLESPYVIHFRSTTTDVDDWSNNIHVFPNPVACGENITLGTINELGKVQIEIINVLGAVVETRRATSLQTISAPMVAGIYTLRITVEGKGMCYRKLVVR